jgi:hypothetical protein
MKPVRTAFPERVTTMRSKTCRRIVLLSLAASLLLLPAASQAAPRALRAEFGAAARGAEPAQWLRHLWEAVTGLWKSATAGDQTTGTTGSGDTGGATANGDAGASIDPDGHHG